MKLFCAVVGAKGDAFSVRVSCSDDVDDLKKAIKAENSVAFGHADARHLDLYLARKDDAWLPSSGDEVERLSKSARPDTHLAAYKKLDPTKKLARVCGSDLGEEVIHVLIRLPEHELLRQIKENAKNVQAKQRLVEELKSEEEREAAVQRAQEREARIPENRKRRWQSLNVALLDEPVLRNNAKKIRTSRSFSSMEYKQMPDSFRPTQVTSGPFYEMMKHAPAIDDNALNELTELIKLKTRVYTHTPSTGKTGNEATRAQFISAVFEHVVGLIDSIKLDVQVELVGEFLKANGEVDFLVTSGLKKFCVVEAKNWNFDKGVVQSVLGMEVSVEKNEEEIMFGIVTNYIEWHFLKRTDDGIEEFIVTLDPSRELREEVKGVTSRLYAMLTQS